MDPNIQTKKLKYPDPTSTDPTFYYPYPDSAPPNIQNFESDPDRIPNQIRISDKSLTRALKSIYFDAV